MSWILHRSIHGKFALYYLLISLYSTTVLSQQSDRCLKNLPELHAKRYPYYKNSPVTIRVDTSDRITHQLSSHAFRIFAREVLGYPRVEILNFEDHFDIDETVERLNEKENLSIPISTINLEVWIPPDYDTITLESRKFVEDAGNVASVGGRFGWFVPKNLTAPLRKFCKDWYGDVSEIPWTLFRNRKASNVFDVDATDMQMITENSVEIPKMAESTCINCKNGMFIPDQCKDNSPCALLLAPDYSTTSFVIEHIEELKLYVKVVWLGKNLSKVVEHLEKKYRSDNGNDDDNNRSYVILNWTPSMLIPNDEDYLSVAFKKCELLQSTKHLGCKYEMNRLVKFSWIGLQDFGKPLLEALRQYSYRENDYRVLLDMYRKNPERGVEGIACDWMNENYYSSWQDWKPVLDNTIYIGGIFPMHNSPFVGEGIAQAAKMAETAVNENKTILTDYKLELLMSDGQCRSDLVMKMFIDYVVNKQFPSLIGVLGPACSDTVEPLARVSKHYQTMIVSYSAEGASFSDRDKYPYFFRTIGENSHYNYVYVEFLKRMGWRRVAALTEDGQKYTEYISQMQSLLVDNQITFITNVKFPRDLEMIMMTKYLEDLKRKRARIIIADVVNEIARLIMCEAYKLKMTPKEGYIWFLPISYNAIQGGRINCTDEEMIEATNGYFSIAHAYYGEDDQMMQENITVREWRDRYEKRTKKTSNYAGYAYDAVWTYALATDKLARTDPEALSHIHSNTTIKKLMTIINETDFMGVSGRIKFRGGPSRFSTINIMQWYDNQTHIVGQFHPNLTDHKPKILGGRLDINSSLIRWFTADAKKPDDGTLPPDACALDGLARFFNVDCSMAIVILNIMVIGTVVMVIGLVIYKIKKRYDKKVLATENYIKTLGFDWWHNIDSLKDLNRWEVPRNDVVINRKIGEGAFGTVFGGEAKFVEADGWLPVAVKTLKTGSSTDEKIDFLSEADVMRNFNHTNIVRLLGVIMNDEPLYAIMEFMLYGDLKTYLLSRRHLVLGKYNSDEVSNERLTSMALDVARGLSYLAESRFVHRDLASRNCLVNANRMVKIGDFGMCRPICEKEYYRFSRRGMLPVRWMAPESLSLGVYTSASDVWSYGVLLYEIVTFGSFPFQGLSNSEVLAQVKNGKTLNIPKGVKPQLEALMNSCWSKSWKARPHAKEIVAYIAGYKELLTPCLDEPLSSVQIENSDEIEMHFPDRKCSTPTAKNFPVQLGANGTVVQTGFDQVDAVAIATPNYRRQTSMPEHSTTMSTTAVNIPMENYCPREPLLGLGARGAPNCNNYAKYSCRQQTQLANNDSGLQDDDDYIPASLLMNGHVISEI